MPAIIGAVGLERRLAAIADPAGRRDFVGRLSLQMLAVMKSRIPRKTSTTSRTLRIGSVSETNATIVGSLNAIWLDRGTRPHLIVPRRRKALRWAATPEGRRLSGRPRTATQRGELGGVRFAKRVHHPGTRAQPYIDTSIREALARSGLSDAIVTRWNRAD